MKICLDAGHSYGLNGKGKDPGAINDDLDLKESVIAMQIVLKIGKILRDKGHNVFYTRENGSNEITLAKRCSIANSGKADVFVSIHLNSAENKSAYGIETLRYPTKNKKTVNLANLVQECLIKATGVKDRGVKERDNLYVLKHTDMPAILVEVGFISNNVEASRLVTSEYQDKVVKAIVDGISMF